MAKWKPKPIETAKRPTIVCLCGSTRFYKEFQRANYEETMKGRIVLSVGFYMHESEAAHGEKWGCTPEQKLALDALHFRKIELADEVLVLDVNGYIGESTRNEINHATALHKRIRYRSQEIAPAQSLCTCGDQWCPACMGTLDEYRANTRRVLPDPPGVREPKTMPRLSFICEKCGIQQHADGICANCGADALRPGGQRLKQMKSDERKENQ